ncbi:MAG: hypothetical protein ACYCSN_16600 [Acidobacteriaceae bacterium]
MSTKPKPAALGAGLVRKGTATPPTPATAPPQAVQVATTPAPAPAAGTYYKAVTLKLDKSRYSALKTLGLREDKSSQELLTVALDAFLVQHGLR